MTVLYLRTSIVSLMLLASAFGCNRKTSQENGSVQGGEDMAAYNNADTGNITAEDPFRNQPNPFCTVIRKLDINHYRPGQTVDDPTDYPEKYCLLDVCLDHISNPSLVISLGDSSERVSVNYSLIKIFENTDSVRRYVAKYHIVDVVY